MRLIDADALIEFIENRYDITWEDDYEGGIKDACTDILEKISKMPTIEPERKTGQWVGYNADDPNWQRDDGTPVFLMCSACQAFVINNGAANWNYCPGCGSYNGGEQDEVG